MTTKEKFEKLRIFMKKHHITWPALADHLGLSAQGAAALCRREACKDSYRDILIRLGFPEDLIPNSNSPVFPGLQKNDISQQKTELIC